MRLLRHDPHSLTGAYALDALDSPEHSALGVGEKSPDFETSERRMVSGERLILLTDGITGRRVKGGGTFGADGLRQAVERAAAPTAACTAMAVQQAVTDSWREPLEDDGTVVVMAVT
mgnify:CR=1 FL=1